MKKWLTPEREMRIVELYEVHENAREVANHFGVSTETIYRALKKHGIKRTHRHPKERSLSNCRTKYCPALVSAIHTLYGYRAKGISEVTGYPLGSVQAVLVSHGLVERRKRKTVAANDYDLDKIEHEYVELGMSTYELGEKYGVNHATISKWMRQRGIRLGKGGHQRPENHYRAELTDAFRIANKKKNAKQHKDAEAAFAAKMDGLFDGRFEYVSDYKPNGKHVATIRCRECGYVFEHSTDTRKNWQCPSCNEMARNERIERLKRERKREYEERLAQEYAVDKTCECCGATLHSMYTSQKYCSKRCAEKSKGRAGNYRHYYHVHGGKYDPTVTLRALYERDGGVCQICGEPCDWDDREWGAHGPLYPSLDHIIPRSKGGAHTWDNVQLAHCICNSRKRDLPDELAKAEAMAS